MRIWVYATLFCFVLALILGGFHFQARSAFATNSAMFQVNHAARQLLPGQEAGQLLPQLRILMAEQQNAGLALAAAAVALMEDDVKEAAALSQQHGLTPADLIYMGDQRRSLSLPNGPEMTQRWYDAAAAMSAEFDSAILLRRAMQKRDEAEQAAAEELLLAAIRLDRGWLHENERFRAWYTLGNWLHTSQSGRGLEAVAILTEAIQSSPDAIPVTELSEAYRLRGLAYHSLRRGEAAQADLAKAVELAPNSSWAHVHYAKILYVYAPEEIEIVLDEFAQALLLADDLTTVWNSINLFSTQQQFDFAAALCPSPNRINSNAESYCD